MQSSGQVGRRRLRPGDQNVRRPAPARMTPGMASVDLVESRPVIRGYRRIGYQWVTFRNAGTQRISLPEWWEGQ
jgi:hypothetical protein